MTRLLLIILLFLSNAPAYAEWVTIRYVSQVQ